MGTIKEQMVQEIKVEKEPFSILPLPRVTNPAQPEDVARGKRYIDPNGVVQRGTRRTNVLTGEFLSIRQSALQLTGYGYLGTLADVIGAFSSIEGLVGFSARQKDEYELGEIGMAVLSRYDDAEPYWRATRFAGRNYFDADTMLADDPDIATRKIGTVPIDPSLEYVTVSTGLDEAQLVFFGMEVLDADGNTLTADTGLVRKWDSDHSYVIRSGWYLSLPEGAAFVRFKVLATAASHVMVTRGHTGDELPAEYGGYGDNWDTLVDLDEEALLPAMSVYDYYTTVVTE